MAKKEAQEKARAAEVASKVASVKDQKPGGTSEVTSKVASGKDLSSDLASKVASTTGLQELREVLTSMWHLSAWRKGHAWVFKEAKKTSDLASHELARTVYKWFVDHNGSPEGFDDLLRHHGIDPSAPTAPPTSPPTSSQAPPTSPSTPPTSPLTSPPGSPNGVEGSKSGSNDPTKPSSDLKGDLGGALGGALSGLLTTPVNPLEELMNKTPRNLSPGDSMWYTLRFSKSAPTNNRKQIIATKRSYATS